MKCTAATFPVARAPLTIAVLGVLGSLSAQAANVSWIPDADGNWATAANWSSAPALPGAVDDVIIDVGGDTRRTVTITSAAAANTLVSQENLTLAAGSLALAGESAVHGDFLLSGGVLSGAGALTLHSAGSTWSSGSLTGTGSTRVAGTLTLSGGDLKDINGRALSVLAGGTVNWSNTGNGNGRIRTGGTTLSNAGQWNDQSTFNNQISNDLSASASSFANTGTYTKTGAALTTFAIAFNNSGLVDVQAGTLNLSSGGSGGGEFRAGANGVLNFSGSGYSFTDGAAFSGAGAKNLSGGNFVLNGTQTGANLNLVSGSYTGTQSFAGEVEWLGGAFQSGGATSVAAGASFSLTGSDLKDINARSFNVLAGGTLNWSNTGNGNGRIRTGGTTLSNAGQWNDQSTFNNQISNDLSASSSSFANSGTYAKTGAALTNFAIALNNSGLVDVQAGTLNLSGGGSGGGEFRASSDGTLNFSSPGYSFADGAVFSGAGAKNLNGGNFVLNGTQTGTNLNLVSGSYTGTHTFAGEVEWLGGAFQSGGATSVAAGASFGLTGGELKDINARGFNVLAGGTLNWSNTGNGNGRIRTGGATLSNAGQWNDQSTFNNQISNDLSASASSFANSGTYTKSGAALTTFALSFSNSGLVDVQAGTLNLSNGGGNTASGVMQAGPLGVLTFSSGFSFSDGSALSGVGAKNLNSGTFAINGLQHVTNLNLLGGSYQGTHTFDGDVDWLDGSFSGAGTTSVADSASFNLTGGALKDINGRALSVLAGGTVNWSNTGNGNGRIRTGGASLSNAGQWNDQSAFNNQISNDLNSSPSSFTNSGTYTKSGAALTTFAIAFNNNGLVDVLAGTMNVDGGGSTAAEFRAGPDGTINFGGPGYTFAEGAMLSGAGAKNLTTGTFSITGVQHVTNLNLLGGSYQGTHTFDGDVDWLGGNFSGAGTTSIADGASFNVTGSALKDISGRTLSVAADGTVNWSNTGNNNGRIRTGGASLSNAGQWNDQNGFDNQISNDLSSAPSRFTNSGIYTKTGTALTTVAIALDNSGLVDVRAGTMNVTGGGSTAAEFRADTGGTLNFGGPGYSFADGAVLSGAGAKNLTAGTFSINGLQHVTNLNLLGGSYQGTHTFDGDVDWLGGNFGGAGTTSIAEGASLSLMDSTLKDINGRSLSVLAGGTVNWNNTGNGNGRIRTGGAILSNAGQWNDQSAFNNQISNDLSASLSSFSNSGTYTKTGAGLTSFDLAFNNSGVVDVRAGTLTFSTDVTQHVGNTLTGGTWRVSGTGSLQLNEPGAQNIVTNQGDVTLDGTGASFARINTVTTNAGALRLLGGRNFTAVGGFTNTGTLQLGGGSFGAPSFTNGASGEIVGFGSLTPTILNSGRVRASGGTLTLVGGVDGQSGTLESDAGATLALGANSDGDFLLNNGALALGAFDVTVAKDYTNASFGEGNDFDARAEVSGSGRILASGDLGQTLAGDLTDGAGGAPQVAFGHLHVGDVAQRTFSVQATGSSGPVLRGALQTGAGGGLIDDSRLSGSGVTAQNFGPLAGGEASGPYTVTLSGDFAGALSGQQLAVVNNFDNVAEQMLGISGAVFRYANPGAITPAPVDFGKRRIGETVSQALTLVNDVPADGFSEALDATFGTSSAAATHNAGSVALLGPGTSDDSSLAVGIDTSVAGLRNGTVEVLLASNGEGSSGLGITDLSSQTVNVQAEVYRLASASTVAPVLFANRHVGDAATQFLSVGNTAAADGFSERLNASIGGATGDITTNGGAFALLDAGANSDNALAVSLDTASAGHKSGTATISLATDGTGTSGYAALDLGTQVVAVSGDVFRYASAGPVADLSFGNVHVGDVLSQALVLTNAAVADGYSEALDASFAAASDTRIQTSGTVSGLAAQQTDTSSLVVTVDTSSAGSIDGFVTLALRSNGAGSSGLGFTDLGNVDVGVRTNVGIYRYAEAALLSGTPIDLGAARVGDVVPLAALALANVAADDGFSESLDASFGTVGSGFNVQGSVTGLVAGTSSNALSVGLATDTSGVRSSEVEILLASNGAGSSGLGITTLVPQNVTLTGKVYDLAQASADATSIDFGIVHVGDALPSRAITIANVGSGALVDSLRGEVAAVSAGFQASGALPVAGIAAGASSSGLAFVLDTSAQGLFNGIGTLAFASHNPDMADVALPSLDIALSGQVNAYANPVLSQAGGAGDFVLTGATSFALDFGVLSAGQTGVQGLLALTNLVSGPADVLGADFDLSGGSFTVASATSFSDLAAGDSHTLTVGLDPLVAGLFEQVLRIHLYGENASGYHGTLGSFEVTLRAFVEPAPVPLPMPLWLLGAGLSTLVLRRRQASTAA